jgi:hypothetical protein
VDLRSESRQEVDRLHVVRALAASATRRAAATRTDSSRGAVTAVRGSGDTSVCWAIRLLFLDADGNIAWDTIVAATLRGQPHRSFRHAAELRNWLDGVHAHLALPLAASAARAHDDMCARVETEIGRAYDRLAARDRAILRILRDRDARLAREHVRQRLDRGRVAER